MGMGERKGGDKNTDIMPWCLNFECRLGVGKKKRVRKSTSPGTIIGAVAGNATQCDSMRLNGVNCEEVSASARRRHPRRLGLVSEARDESVNLFKAVSL
jgi:hypothetical protein